MALTTEEIATHPALHASIRQQSQRLLQAYEAGPRLASVFATQQRWLMAHAGACPVFQMGSSRTIRSGLNAARFFDMIRDHAVASRNTADAFIKEMLRYNFARYAPGSGDKRIRAMEPTQASIDALNGWAVVHLATLDTLDGGQRLERYMPGVGPARQAAAADRRRPAHVEGHPRAAANLLPVHLAQQWRHRHGLADRRNRARGRRS